jgi:type IX secretion system PorP/SprF family membrane protein
MKKNYIITLLLLITTITVSYSQDVHFSQFYENAVLRNPGLIGVQSEDYKVGINYRNQWSSIATPFVTGLLYAETKFLINRSVQDYLSCSITQVHYQAGNTNFTNNTTYAGVNYNKSLDDNSRTYLSLGFAGGYTQRSYDLTKMTFSNQYLNGSYDANNPSNEIFVKNNATSYDVGAGMALNGSLLPNKRGSYYLGIAAYNLLKPLEQYQVNDVFVNRSIRYTCSVGIRIPSQNGFGVTLLGNYQVQYPYEELVGGILLGWKKVSVSGGGRLMLQIGSMYRLGDAIIPTVKISHSSWSLNFSYDYVIGDKFGSRSFGGYELSLFVKGNYKHKKYVPDPTRCPRFEDMMAPEDIQ